MKNNMTLKTVVATVTTILLAQPLMAIYPVDSNDCYAPTNVNSKTINVPKFTHVWQKLHRDSSQDQPHLQMYINEALDNSGGMLDVQKFSSVWQKLNTNGAVGKEHLTQYIEVLLENASSGYACSATPIICTTSIDVAKFSTLWNEVKVKNNQSVHLNSALTALVDSSLCNI
ncbi:MAG: Unknown protein [uncultured Sulfurovum sp.]|uniref:Uncharacterized protein n=1 Tax=uncultured Sulfurovum sp. TaxID=269237 RepID=A0A6S6SB88_9BACT|nr:MAG: Unknown protein [uncultured Sulfurovum sp.]